MYEGKKGMYALFSGTTKTPTSTSTRYIEEIAQAQFGNTGQWHRAQYFKNKDDLKKNLTEEATSRSLCILCLLHGPK